jgi:hypothetical protein
MRSELRVFAYEAQKRDILECGFILAVLSQSVVLNR